MNMIFKTAVASIAIMAAMPASAAITVLAPNAASQVFTGDFSAIFGNGSSTAGSFTDSFNFTTTTGGLSGSLTAKAGTKNITITSVKLDSLLFTNNSSGSDDQWDLVLTNLAAGAHSIIVTGLWDSTLPDVGGSYGGQIDFTVSAAPEPATWGMMIAGFGIAGVALRRRRRENVRVTYA